MTGLKPETDAIIEIATMVTDKELEIVAEGPVLAIHQTEEVLARMDDWNQRQHGSSGLLARVRASRISVAEAEQRTLEFLAPLVPPAARRCAATASARTAASSRATCRELEQFFHYRNLDVSTLKELARRWAPPVRGRFREAGYASCATPTSASRSASCSTTARGCLRSSWAGSGGG